MILPLRTLRTVSSRTSIAPTMNRRGFVTGLGAMLATPLAAEAQQARKVPRIGLLDYAKFWDPLLAALNELGYVEGRTIIVEYRSSEGRSERLSALALDLVKRSVDIIVVYGTPATQVAKRATATIPIVMVGVGEPVDTGLVASLARPGGNITGSTILGADLGAKRVELLREAIPRISRVAFLLNPQNASNRVQFEHVQAGVRALGLRLLSVQVSGPDEFDDAFAAMMKQRPDALMVTADPAQQRFVERIVRFAAAQRLPTIYQVKENVIDGGLISYGPSLPDLFGRCARYVDRILKGAKPGDLPVEQPTKFELAINLKTARALGLTIPPSLLLRADQVIE
jgi:putative tryptophan/tyrosine transport system substrate-binding protein